MNINDEFRSRGVALDFTRRDARFMMTAVFHIRLGSYWSVTAKVPTSTPIADVDRALARSTIEALDKWLSDKHLGGDTAAEGW